ncbi:MAG: hypothetical protein JW760_13690 [Spirochaetales bacterium]|nr:hypothetical protein [Spirochaetales bacterium]
MISFFRRPVIFISLILLGLVNLSLSADQSSPGTSSLRPLIGQLMEDGGKPYLRYHCPEIEASREKNSLRALAITYSTDRQGHNETEIRLGYNGRYRNHTLVLRLGTHQVFLYPELSGSWPGTLDIDVPEGVEILEVALSPLPADEQPIPADMGTIMAYPPEQWRREEYECFSWNLAPAVLVYVTRNYQDQARRFKRLAFFVEKPGFSGVLQPNEVIEHRHGWNAHDYRAEDLARFFRRAEEENFELNPEERELYQTLEKHSILFREDGIIQAGTGSVLSISMETPKALRAKFLVHEAFHGLFFISPRFRLACLDTWRSLAPEEQNFWKTFFSHRTYNVKNEFLLVNEFMAYLMQQPKDELDWYYKEFIFQELTKAYPAKAASFEAFYRTYPETFHLSASKIERTAEILFGVRAGDLNCIIYNP